MRPQFFREAFDPARPMIACRPIPLSTGTIGTGDTFDPARVTPRLHRQLFDQRRLKYPGESGRSMCKPPHPPIRTPTPPRPALEIRQPRAPAPASPKPSRRIPDDWRSAPWPEKLAMASLYSNVTVENETEADDAIEAEIFRRRMEGRRSRRKPIG